MLVKICIEMNEGSYCSDRPGGVFSEESVTPSAEYSNPKWVVWLFLAMLCQEVTF